MVMKKNGFTLVEVILAIALIGLIAVTFIPAMTFGFQNLIDSEKFVVDSYAKQQDVEKILDAKRKEVADSADTLEINVFGVNVKGHVVSVDIEGHGEINTFQPQRTVTFDVLEIIPKGHMGNPDVLLDVVSASPRPTEVNLFFAGSLNDTVELLVNESNFTVNIPSIHLVNVYKWFLSSEQEKTVGYVLDNYSVIKEWNAARTLVSYAQSSTLKITPNIQNSPDYNRLKFSEVKNGLSLTDEEMINRFGNRYVYYSVTPYAISGRVGKEDLSNAIYIRAPRIEIDKAYYGTNPKQVEILFKEPISGAVNTGMINTNAALGTLVNATRSTINDKILILEFENDLAGTTDIKDNFLSKGAVASISYGNISIWSGEKPNGKFDIIYVPPIPVTSVLVTPSALPLVEGTTSTLSITIAPSDATNKKVLWKSSEPSIVSVDDSGNIIAKASGTAIITAQSVSNPTVFGSCTVIVPVDSNIIGLELEAELAKIHTLSVSNATYSKPVINAPSDDISKAIAYTLSGGEISGGTSIVLQAGNKAAIITRDNTTTQTLNITLTAKKSNGVTDIVRNKAFKVLIPSNSSTDKIVLIAEPLDQVAIEEMLTVNLSKITTLNVVNANGTNTPESGKPVVEAQKYDSVNHINYFFNASQSKSTGASVDILADDNTSAVVTRQKNTSNTRWIDMTASYTNGVEVININQRYIVQIPSNISGDAITVSKQ